MSDYVNHMVLPYSLSGTHHHNFVDVCGGECDRSMRLQRTILPSYRKKYRTAAITMKLMMDSGSSLLQHRRMS